MTLEDVSPPTGPGTRILASDQQAAGASGQVAEITDFGGLTVAFDHRVLRPRPWTVLQSEWARELLPDLPAGEVLEVCAGVGHIGLRAVHGTDRRLLMVDASEVACRYAALNAQHARMSQQVDLRCGPMEHVLDPAEQFALVVADPPWVPSSAVDRHPEDPLHAIDGGSDGLDLVRTSLEVIGTHLLPGGAALLQVGTDQVADVEREVRTRPEHDLEVAGHRFGAGGAVVHLRRRSL